MAAAAQPSRPAVSTHRSPRWVDDWRPEDPLFWSRTGKTTARRNLTFSIFSEHIGFSVWAMWSVLVLFLGPQAHHHHIGGGMFEGVVQCFLGNAVKRLFHQRPLQNLLQPRRTRLQLKMRL